MEFMKVLQTRFSCRKFTSEPVTDDIIKKIVRAGTLAPSINDSQPWKFIVIKDKNILQQMAKAVSDKMNILPFKGDKEKVEAIKKKVTWFSTFFKDAPAVILVLTTDYSSKLDQILDVEAHQWISKSRNNPDIQSLGACMQNMLLASYDLGLASVWLSAPVIANKEFQDILKFDGANWKVGSMAAIGYPAIKGEPSDKKDINELLTIIG